MWLTQVLKNDKCLRNTCCFRLIILIHNDDTSIFITITLNLNGKYLFIPKQSSLHLFIALIDYEVDTTLVFSSA